jgi:hypothetical protein
MIMPLSLMPSAEEEVFIDRSQPEFGGIRSASRYVLVPSYRKGMEKADESSPTTQPSEFTPRADPSLVPAASGIATIPFASDQINGKPEP